MEYNTCKTCKATDGKAGVLVDDECTSCRDKRQISYHDLIGWRYSKLVTFWHHMDYEVREDGSYIYRSSKVRGWMDAHTRDWMAHHIADIAANLYIKHGSTS